MDTENHSFREAETSAGPSAGSENLNRNGRIVGDSECTSLRVQTSGGTHTEGPPEKNHLMFPAEGGKSNHLEKCHRILFFFKRAGFGRKDLTTAYPAGVSPEPN